MPQGAVSIGQRFVDARSPMFAHPWIVEKTFTGSDGIEYAHVVCADDPTRRKTLSAAVLADTRWYTLA
jgi:hypothetical protein